jgi:PEP-CTERM motif
MVRNMTRRQMKRVIQVVATAGALALGASAANAADITWNFGTSGYSLSTGPIVSPPAAPSFTATSGPFSATASGNTAAITAISPVYQDALFTSGGFTVAAYAWGNGGNTQDKVTQSNNYATTINGASVHITGLGACSSLCSGFSTTLGDTEWLTLALGSHPDWSLQSIVFGDVMNSPGEQVEFWFSNDATRSAALSGTKYDDTILQMGANVCVGGIGANGSCLFDFSALGVDPDNYPYLWATAVNPNSSTANQPAILITQLTATTDAVPEPSTLSVLGIGLLILGVAWRRREAA